MEIEELWLCLKHFAEEHKQKPDCIVACRISDSQELACWCDDFEDSLVDQFSIYFRIHCVNSPSPLGAIFKGFEQAALRDTKEHWITILHHPFTINPKALQYMNAMIPSARLMGNGSLDVLKIVEFNSCDLHPNEQSVVDPFVHELIFSSFMLQKFLDEPGCALLCDPNSFGWHSALLCYCLGKEAYKPIPLDEKLGETLQELIWPLGPLSFTNGRCIFPPAKHEHFADSSCRLLRDQYAMDFFYRVPTELIGVALKPICIDEEYDISVKDGHIPKKKSEKGDGPNLRKMAHISRSARTRTNSLLFVFLCGWLSESRFWEMTLTNIVVTPQFKDYLHADIVCQIVQAIKEKAEAASLITGVFIGAIKSQTIVCFKEALILAFQADVKHTLVEIIDLIKCHKISSFQALTLDLLLWLK